MNHPPLDFGAPLMGESPIIKPKIVSTAYDHAKVYQSINEIVSKTNLMSLSTVRETTPYSCVVVFAFDKNLCLIYFSEKTTDHSQNLLKNDRIAGEIADTNQTWAPPRRGIQFQGTARPATADELGTVINLYMARFPGFERSKIDARGGVSPVKVYPYIVRPTTIKIFDEKIFGKETWAVVKLLDKCALSDEM